MPRNKNLSLEKRKSPSQARSRIRVELIMRSTLQLLREQGLAAVTTNAIAGAANIPVSSVYQYFPNKESILVELYRTYLARVRQVLVDFEAPQYLVLGRPQFLDALINAIFDAESRDHIEIELEKAMTLYPALAEVDRLHREQTAGLLARLLQQLGSHWSKAKLHRLALFLYAMNTGAWTYRAHVQPPRRELQAWQRAVGRAVLASCFE